MNLLQNFHLADIEYLYRWRRAVPLQTFTTRHSNRKLSIVMALSTTFTQCAPKTTKFGLKTQNKGHFAVPGLEGHSRSPILVRIESSLMIHIWSYWAKTRTCARRRSITCRCERRQTTSDMATRRRRSSSRHVTSERRRLRRARASNV